MDKKLKEWIKTDVQPFREKSIPWISRYHFFRVPIQRAYPDAGCFFSPADEVIVHQPTVEPEEAVVKTKRKAYTPREALRDPGPSARRLVTSTGRRDR